MPTLVNKPKRMLQPSVFF